MKLRLYQLLAKSGLIQSKKEAEKLLENIKINKKIPKSLNYFVDPKKDQILLNNQLIKPIKENLYFILNKPKGIETTKQNLMQFLKNIKNLDEKIKNTLSPAGRLDKYSEGLIILTNDGKLINQLLNPENHIEKTYIITTEKEITKEQLNQLKDGIEIQMEENNKFFKYKTKPCSIKQIKTKTYEITLKEGKKRQIRRMLEAINNKVLTLKRIKISNLSLGNLKPGEIKAIEKEYIFVTL